MTLEFFIFYYLDLLILINFLCGQEVFYQVNCFYSLGGGRDEKLHATVHLVAGRAKSCPSPFMTRQTLCQELNLFSLQSQQKSVYLLFLK